MPFTRGQRDGRGDLQGLLIDHPDHRLFAAGDVHRAGARDGVQVIGCRAERDRPCFPARGVHHGQGLGLLAADEQGLAVVADVQAVHVGPDSYVLTTFPLATETAETVPARGLVT